MPASAASRALVRLPHGNRRWLSSPLFLTLLSGTSVVAHAAGLLGHLVVQLALLPGGIAALDGVGCPTVVGTVCQCAHPFEVFVARVIPSRLNDIIVLITVFVNKISFKLQHSLVGWVVVTDIGKIKFHDGLPDGTNQFCKIS